MTKITVYSIARNKDGIVIQENLIEEDQLPSNQPYWNTWEEAYNYVRKVINDGKQQLEQQLKSLQRDEDKLYNVYKSRPKDQS